jgi:oxygen-independent coproporphyrinogen-3 oxidase
MKKYIDSLIYDIKTKYSNTKFKTIYIGGGTPNHLPDYLLDALLSQLKMKLKEKCEFTIECNPEQISKNQIKIFKKNAINRVSLGVQTTNDKILKAYNRNHTFADCKKALKRLYRAGINNVSCDFIYGFKEQTNTDIINAIKFIKKFHISHASFYSLELKDNSVISHQNYQLSQDKIEAELKLIIKHMKKLNYHRYEVSSFARHHKYESAHNLAY